MIMWRTCLGVSSLSQWWRWKTSVLDLSPPVPPPTTPAPPETAGPSSSSQKPYEHIPVTSREFLAVMDAVRALTTPTTSLAAS